MNKMRNMRKLNQARIDAKMEKHWAAREKHLEKEKKEEEKKKDQSKISDDTFFY